MPDTSAARLTAREKAFVVSMCATIAVTTSNWAMLATFFPIWAAQQGLSPYAVSAIFTSFQIGKLVTSVVAGQCANRFGRRAIMIVGVLLVILTGAALGFTPELAGDDLSLLTVLFIVPRFLQGCGSGLVQLSIIAILSDTFTQNRGLIVGTAGSMEALGYFIGPPIGGWLYAASGFRTPFLALATLVALNLVSILCLYPTKPAGSSTTTEASAVDAGDSVTKEVRATGTAEPPDATSTEGALPPHPQSAQAADAPTTDSAPSLDDAPPPAKSPSRTLSWWLLLRRLPLELWWTCVTAMVYMSKWAWWEIYFAEWCVDEFGASIPTASLYIATIAACFALGVPLAGTLGDRLGKRRFELMVVSLAALVGLYAFVGPWQLTTLTGPMRYGLFFCYLAGDGLLCCLLEPQLIPHVLYLAEADGGSNEHLTNLVTSAIQTAMNIGMVAGPFVAVPIVKSGGFRGALFAWAIPLGLMAMCAGLLRAGAEERCSRLRMRATAPKRLVELEI